MTRILVVEDDPHLSHAMSRLLRRHFDVDEVRTLAGALVALVDTIDVVLTDWHLGPDDGLVLLQQARDRFPRVRRILMTASALDPHSELRLRACGAVMLRKPFELEVLRAAIDQNAEYSPDLSNRNVS
jgi:DNA-binding response OmpR family regulator